MVTGCTSVATSNAELEYRMRLLERRMNMIESDFDSLIDQCTEEDLDDKSN